MSQYLEPDDADFFVFVPRISGVRTRFQVRQCIADDFERMHAVHRWRQWLGRTGPRDWERNAGSSSPNPSWSQMCWTRTRG